MDLHRRARRLRKACPRRSASCSDQTKDGDETDVDRGGACGPCGFGKACGKDADCKTTCTDGLCVEPASCNPADGCPGAAYGCFERSCRRESSPDAPAP